MGDGLDTWETNWALHLQILGEVPAPAAREEKQMAAVEVPNSNLARFPARRSRSLLLGREGGVVADPSSSRSIEMDGGS